ncbi:MAG: FHIPEP family type III secretion protein [Deltaproteobacteria bacterium]
MWNAYLDQLSAYITPRGDDPTIEQADWGEHDLVRLEIGYGLIPLAEAADADSLVPCVQQLRRWLYHDWGFLMPAVRIIDDLSIGKYAYRIRLSGRVVATGRVQPNERLVVDVTDAPNDQEVVRDPVFGFDGYWVDPDAAPNAEHVSASMVIAAHLGEILRQRLGALLQANQVATLVELAQASDPKAVDAFRAASPRLGHLLWVLRELLNEGVPIRDLTTILDTYATEGLQEQTREQALASVRLALATSITTRFARDARLSMVMLSESLNHELEWYCEPERELDTERSVAIIRSVHDAMLTAECLGAVLVVRDEVRGILRHLRVASMPPLLALGEITSDARADVIATVGLSIEPARPAHTTSRAAAA